MKKIFYSIMALALLTGCSNEDMLPEVPNEGLIELASVGIGTQTRGSVNDEGQFSFSDGDKVLMTVEVNENSFSNSFTYNAAGNKWTQDAPVGDYRSIYVQDNPTINSIVSYGGDVQKIFYTDQSSMEKYAKASSLAADQTRGKIDFDGHIVSARLGHYNSDLALKVYDGYDEKNTLAEGTPVLKVIIDIDGQGPASITETYTAWNAGKASDADGNVYTLFRVQLRNFSSILKAELSNVNATAGDLKTEILFRASDGQPSNEIDLEAGRRYSASYTYDMLKTVATVNVSISAFEDNDNQNITASRDWSFNNNTNTYTVFSAEGLQIVNQDIANNIATKGTYNITLAADITLPAPVAPETSNWIPLGLLDENYRYYSFNGTFDGAGYTISNLQIKEDKDYMALIGVAGKGCKVKNLTLDKPIISSGEYSYAAGIVGYYYGFDGSESIINCHIKDGSIKGRYEVGGIAGQSVGNIMACTVSGTTIDGYSQVGGITGSQNHGRIIACGVDEVNLRCSDDWFGGIAGFWYVTGLTESPAGYMYSCYAKDCTKGTDSQALAGTANLLGAFDIFEGYSLTAYNCAYRPKGGSITYGVGGTKSGYSTNGNHSGSELLTRTGTADSDWPTASRDLNVGINEWNGFDPTFPCNWEWNTATTEEGKLKVKQ